MEEVEEGGVVIFPLPIQGSINSMLQLGELLCLSGINVTFLNTKHNQRRLLGCSNVESRFERYSGELRFLTLDDGLPEGHSRSVEQFGEIIGSLQRVAEPLLREIILKEKCVVVIADALCYYAVDIGNEIGVAVIPFDTMSPSCVWVYMCLPQLIQAAHLPFTPGNDLEAVVTNIPAMEGLLRRRDLPFNELTSNAEFQAALKEVERIREAHALILNTFEDLDGPLLSCFRSYPPKTYAIGPLHLHLKARLAAKGIPFYSNSLWEEDNSSIEWLDEQPMGSVIYVSFGSLVVASREEILEFWHGLLNSQVKFLWVMRPNILKGGETDLHFMKDLAEGCTENGYMASWVPQAKVLAHPAVGGFLTHSGWNSTLESMVEGKPMICWPHYVDQRVSSRLVSEVWKIGLDMKDKCERSTIERMVIELMGTKRAEFKKSAEKLSELAKVSVEEGGSSYKDLDCLVHDIKRLTRKHMNTSCY